MSARIEAAAVELPTVEEPVIEPEEPVIEPEKPIIEEPTEEVITPELVVASTAVVPAEKPVSKAKTGVLAGLGAAIMSTLGSI
jgi:hypothetical protein